MSASNLAVATSQTEDCWQEMERRWSVGDPLHSEEAFERWPELLANASAAVDVLYAEFVLAERYGKSPSSDDFIRRYPQYESQLKRQFDLHFVMSSSTVGPLAQTYDHELTAPASPEIICPGHWDRYHLVSRLGTGSQAEVFRAIHPGLETEVVIKIGRHSSQLEPAAAERLRQEARLLASLKHEHIAKVVDLGVFQARPYLVLEYVRGRNLEQHVQQHPLPPADAARLVAKLARALDEAHRQGVTHLDIKPRNIVVEASGEPRLIDFGLSAVTDAWNTTLPTDGQLAGTIQYMSPEQARAKNSQVGPKSDIFSLGGVLFYLLTGEALYAAATFAETLELAAQGGFNHQALDGPGIPQGLREVCLRALQTEPDQRYESAAKFAEALEACGNESGPPTSWIRQIGVFATVLLTLTALAIAITQWPFRDGTKPEASAQANLYAQTSLALKIQVWDRNRFLELENTVPLRTGDRIRATAEIPANHSAVMFLVSGDGNVQRLTDVPKQPRAAMLSYPVKPNEVVPITGVPGTEVLFVCCRKGPPISTEEFRGTLLAEPWPSLPSASIVRMTSASVTIEQASKSVGAPETIGSPESSACDYLDDLRDRLLKTCSAVEAIAFCHSE